MKTIFGLWVAMMVMPAAAAAQGYPTKPVRFIVPFPPGSGADVIGRVVSQKLADKWGQQVVIDNRAGAGGNIAAEIAAAAPPDGRTIYQFNIANAIAPALLKSTRSGRTMFRPRPASRSRICRITKRPVPICFIARHRWTHWRRNSAWMRGCSRARWMPATPQ